MQPLFSVTGRRRLEQVVQPGLMCVFDFDGTLSPIVDHPQHAELPDAILQRLLMLSQRVPVGVLTGRGLDDIRQRLGFAPHYLVGNHGMEGLPGHEGRHAHYQTICADWEQQLRSRLLDPATALPDADRLLIENKRYSLSLHYRATQDPHASLQHLRELALTLQPTPRLIEGKFVLNLLPAQALDKGGALQRLIDISGCSTVLYVGDDVTDEDAFRLRYSHPGLLSIRVEPHEQSAAEFYLPRGSDILHLLDYLLERLGAAASGETPHVPAATNGQRSRT